MILWLDLETYSETPITDGAYKYAETAKVLLFSYAIDDAPACVFDGAHGQVWPRELLDALAAENPQQANIAKLRFFVGLSAKETGDVLGISEKTVQRHWILARTWLYEAIKGTPHQGDSGDAPPDGDL
jgi:DNA-directed RNA polymerase specialized sigma subunit